MQVTSPLWVLVQSAKRAGYRDHSCALLASCKCAPSIWGVLSSIHAGNCKLVTQGAEIQQRKSMGPLGQVPLGTTWAGCLTSVRRERLGDTHSYLRTPLPTHPGWQKHQKIQSEIPSKESIKSTILLPREDKIYTLLIINEFHKPLETLGSEFAKC